MKNSAKPSPIVFSHLTFICGQSGRLQRHSVEHSIHPYAYIHIGTTLRIGLVSYGRTNNLLEPFISLKSWKKEKRIGSAFVAFQGVLKGIPKPAPGFDSSRGGLQGRPTVRVTAMTDLSDRI